MGKATKRLFFHLSLVTAVALLSLVLIEKSFGQFFNLPPLPPPHEYGTIVIDRNSTAALSLGASEPITSQPGFACVQAAKEENSASMGRGRYHPDPRKAAAEVQLPSRARPAQGVRDHRDYTCGNYWNIHLLLPIPAFAGWSAHHPDLYRYCLSCERS